MKSIFGSEIIAKDGVKHIPFSCVVMLASEGRLTLQVPTMYLFPDETQDQGKITPLDPKYFIFLKMKGSRHIPHKNGFLYLTLDGFNHFRKDLKAAFANTRGHSWEAFVDNAEAFWVKVAEDISKEIAAQKKVLSELNTALACLPKSVQKAGKAKSRNTKKFIED